jgi:hypothetical protein
MHASLWTFKGEPDELLRRYESMVTEIPASSMRLHLCLRADDGIVVIDTCPSEDIFREFAAGPFRALRVKHGLPAPERLEDFPVHAAFLDGERRG